MPEKLFLETNVLLDYLGDFEDFYISSITYQELENIKSSSKKDESIKYKARRVLNWLETNPTKFRMIATQKKHYKIVEKFDLECINDYLIVACAYDLIRQGKDIRFVTNDVSCKIAAENIFKIPVIKYRPQKESYKGWSRIVVSEKKYADFFTKTLDNSYGWNVNEYIIIDVIDDEGRKVDTGVCQWNGQYLEFFRVKNISNQFNEQIEPLDLYQKAFFHMLQDDNKLIKITNSRYGAGKTFLMLNWALQELERGSKRNLFFIKPDNPPTGRKIFPPVPGDVQEKCAPMMGVLEDMAHVSNVCNLLELQPNIEVLPIQFIKGRSLENSIIFINEAQDFTSKEMEKILSRLASGSVALIDGSTQQIDNPMCYYRNGLEVAIENFRDETIAAQVNLVHDYRGLVSKLVSQKRW